METEIFTLSFSELNLSKDILKKAMGYTEEKVYPILDEYIDEVINSGNELCSVKSGYIIIDKPIWNKNDFSLTIDNHTWRIGKIIFQQLKKSTSIAVFVCTAGEKISSLSKEYMKHDDLLKGYVYDLFGSLVVETAMNLVQDRLKNIFSCSGFKMTNRYSPGYCGWDIVEQKNIFHLLPYKFCGIELTDSCLMIPVKSISGIIGIGESVKFNPYSCNLCEANNCLYRNMKVNF